MPPPRRFASVLAEGRLPVRTRVGLLAAEARRRARPRPAYRVPYGGSALFLSHDDYEIDWETLKSVFVDEPYFTDYVGAHVLDIGGHKGYYGAYALTHGASAVVSYEPETVNAAFLARSATSFDPSGRRWRVERAAVSGEAGEADLHVMGASWGHALHPPDAFARYETGIERVPVRALAEVLRLAAGESARGARIVVKINTEGEECTTILGTAVEPWHVVDELLVETHPWASCGPDDLAAYLTASGLTRVESRHERMLQLRRGSPRSGPHSAPR